MENINTNQLDETFPKTKGNLGAGLFSGVGGPLAAPPAWGEKNQR